MMKKNTNVLKQLSVLLLLFVCATQAPVLAFAEYYGYMPDDDYDYYSDWESDFYGTDDDEYDYFLREFEEIMNVHEPRYSATYGIGYQEWLILSAEKKAELQRIYDGKLDAARKAIIQQMIAEDPGLTMEDIMEDVFQWELVNQLAESEVYSDWYESLPYSEQMRILEQDWAIHAEWERAAQERAAAEAAARAAAPIKLVVNGRTIPTDSPPVIEGGRTLAPVRAIVEALGYVVAWDSTTQTIDVYDTDTHDHRISMRIGSNRVKVSTGIWGVMDEKTIDVPAKIINGRTMVPVRFIAETLGCTVSWDEATKTVSIRHNAG